MPPQKQKSGTILLENEWEMDLFQIKATKEFD